MIRFGCPHCGAQLQSAADQAGVMVACPTCGQHLQIPAVANAVLLDAEPRVQCYDCLRSVPASRARRRRVNVGASSGSAWRMGDNAMPTSFGVRHAADVTLCRACYDRRQSTAVALAIVLWIVAGVAVVGLGLLLLALTWH